MYRQDNEHEMKGGILIYIKNNIQVEENKTLNNLSADCKECRWLELQFADTKMILGVVYRKGVSNATNNKLLNQIIDKAARMYDKILICGDFNYPKINWIDQEVDAGPYSASAQFLDCINDSLLTQHVKHFTRVRGDQKPSLIDLVITENDQTFRDDVRHNPPIATSDHCVLIWDYLVAVDNDADSSIINK